MMMSIIKTLKYVAVRIKFMSIVGQLIAGKRGFLPEGTISSDGFAVSSMFGNHAWVPQAEATLYADGNRAIAVNSAMAAFPELLAPVLAHEDGHLSLMAMIGINGHSLLSSELAADRYMLPRVSFVSACYMLVYLEVMNNLLEKQAGSSESVVVNKARIRAIKSYLGL
jgi:hypothetical protein